MQKRNTVSRRLKSKAFKAHRHFRRLHPVVRYGLSLSLAELVGEAFAESLLHISKELLAVAATILKAHN